MTERVNKEEEQDVSDQLSAKHPQIQKEGKWCIKNISVCQ